MKRIKDYLEMFMEWKTPEFSWVLMYKHENRGLGEDWRSLKQMTNEMSFKNLSGNFCWLASSKNFGGNFAGILLVSFTREIAAKHFVQSWKTWEFDHLTPSWAYTWNRSRKHPVNMFFTQNNLKNMGVTNHFQKQTKRTKIFLV